MEYSESLKKNQDFRQVYRKGTSAAERQFVMYVYQNGTDRNRLGISVSKKVGNSVVRHRIRRLIREGYRRHETAFEKGYDIVIVARMAAADCTQQEAVNSLFQLGEKLQIREKEA